MGSSASSPQLRRELILLLAFAIVLAIKPITAGWGLGATASWVGFVALFIWLPGSACIAWIDPDRDALTALFLSFVAGLATLVFAFVPLCMFDARGLVWIAPLCAVLVRIAAHRRGGSSSRPALSPIELVALALPLAVVLWRTHSESPQDWFRGFATDDSFHVENAADLRWRWPMADPRIAGEPMRYHFLSYVSPAAASVVTGLPVRACVLGLGAHFLPLLFALGIYVSARTFRAGAWTASFLALAMVLHVDLGAWIARPLDIDLSFTSPFDVALYGSITTTQGLCMALAIVLVLRDVIGHTNSPRAKLALLAGLTMVASGSKGSILPPILVGIAAAIAWRRIRRLPISRSLVEAFVVMGAAALPFTLWLVLEHGGYAQSMFKWHFSTAQSLSPFQWTVIYSFGGDPVTPSIWATLALFPIWCVGYLGIGAVALAAWFLARSRPATEIENVFVGTLCVGLALGVSLSAAGFSQLFFAYDAQLSAILLGATAAARLGTERSRVARKLAGLGIALLAIQLIACIKTESKARPIVCDFRGDIEPYRAALEWIRKSTPPDAVVLIDDPRLAAAQWTERRSFYETQRYSARLHGTYLVKGGVQEAPQDDLFTERRRLQLELFATPTRVTLQSIRDRLGTSVPIYALRSSFAVGRDGRSYHCDLKPLEQSATFGRELGMVMVREGPSVAVYRLPE